MKIHYTKQARRHLRKLSPEVRERIITKMRWFRLQDDPLSFAQHLTDHKEGEYRFRIGDYRVLCDVQKGAIRILVVLAVRKRDNAYD